MYKSIYIHTLKVIVKHLGFLPSPSHVTAVLDFLFTLPYFYAFIPCAYMYI